jgi:hypothetical protein
MEGKIAESKKATILESPDNKVYTGSLHDEEFQSVIPVEFVLFTIEQRQGYLFSHEAYDYS